MPYGWPSGTAPPLTFVISHGVSKLGLVVERGHRIRLVELPQVNVRHRQLVMLHELPDRGRDRDAHLLGRDGGQLPAAERPRSAPRVTRAIPVRQ